MKIGLIDSGIGGLSVLQAFIREPLMAHYIYVADSKHLPYGTKSEAYIEARMATLAHYLINARQVDALVIACNTATAISAQTLRARYPDFPIIGIEPAIKPAALVTKTQHIAIAATYSTLHSARLQALIARFAQGCTVHKIDAGPWVSLVEAGALNDSTAILNLVAPLNIYPIDQFILGCTHFPFLRPTITTVLGPTIALIDPAFAVAKHTHHLLTEHAINEAGAFNFEYLTTGTVETFTQQIRQIMPDHHKIGQLLI